MAATTRSPRRPSSGDAPTDVFATNIFQPLINAFEWVLLRFHDGIGLGWGLSIICGNKWEPPIFQEVDPMYQAEMIARATECWDYIDGVPAGKEPPEFEAAPVLPPKPTPRLRSLVVPVEEDEVYEAMCRKDNWLSEARDHIKAIIGTDGAAKVNAIHRDAMKTLTPEDVGEVVLGRYKLHRDKAGSVRQTVAKLEDE